MLKDIGWQSKVHLQVVKAARNSLPSCRVRLFILSKELDDVLLPVFGLWKGNLDVCRDPVPEIPGCVEGVR